MGIICSREMRNSGEAMESVYSESMYVQSMAKNTWTDRYHIKLNCFSTSTGRLLKKRSALTMGCEGVAVIQISVQRKDQVNKPSQPPAKLISILHTPAIKWIGMDVKCQVPRFLPMNIWSGTLTVFGFYNPQKVGPCHVTLTGKIVSEKVYLEQQLNKRPNLSHDQWLHIGNILKTELSKIKDNASHVLHVDSIAPTSSLSCGRDSAGTTGTHGRHSLEMTSNKAFKRDPFTSESEDGNVTVRRMSREKRSKARRKDTPSNHTFDIAKRPAAHYERSKDKFFDNSFEEEREVYLNSDDSSRCLQHHPPPSETEEESEQAKSESARRSSRKSDFKTGTEEGSRRKKRSLVTRIGKKTKDKQGPSSPGIHDNATGEHDPNTYTDPRGEDADDECEPVFEEPTTTSPGIKEAPVTAPFDIKTKTQITDKSVLGDTLRDCTNTDNPQCLKDEETIAGSAHDSLEETRKASDGILTSPCNQQSQTQVQLNERHSPTSQQLTDTSYKQQNQELKEATQLQLSPQHSIDDKETQSQQYMKGVHQQQQVVDAKKSQDMRTQQHPKYANTDVILPQPNKGQLLDHSSTDVYTDNVNAVLDVLEADEGADKLSSRNSSEARRDIVKASREQRLSLRTSALPRKKQYVETGIAANDERLVSGDAPNVDKDRKRRNVLTQQHFAARGMSRDFIDMKDRDSRKVDSAISGGHDRITSSDRAGFTRTRPMSKTFSFVSKSKYSSSKRTRPGRSMDEGVKMNSRSQDRKLTKQFKVPPMEAFSEKKRELTTMKNDFRNT